MEGRGKKGVGSEKGLFIREGNGMGRGGGMWSRKLLELGGKVHGG